jgi:hypothetical protein
MDSRRVPILIDYQNDPLARRYRAGLRQLEPSRANLFEALCTASGNALDSTVDALPWYVTEFDRADGCYHDPHETLVLAQDRPGGVMQLQLLWPVLTRPQHVGADAIVGGRRSLLIDTGTAVVPVAGVAP